MARRRLGGDSSLRAARTDSAVTSAFASPEARVILAKARGARERQDSALRAYRATATQRVSVGLGARRLGIEKLFFRGENVAEVAWRRDVGLRIRPLGSRVIVPMGGQASGNFYNATPIPYFPGREQLWFPSSSVGVVKTEVDDREMIHPLARGAERYYRYEAGDSADITLPDRRVIKLRELRIMARRPDWRTFVGSFWFDIDGGQLVRAAYRMANEIDIWAVANEETDKDAAERQATTPLRDSLVRARLPRELVVKDSVRRAEAARRGDGPDDTPPAWVTASFRPLRASLDAITVEYGLYRGKFWLPRAHSATASADAMFMRLPIRFDEKFTYEDVDGAFDLAALPPARPLTAARDSGAAGAVDRPDTDVEISIGIGGKGKSTADRDSVERRRYGDAKIRQCRTDSTWTEVRTRYEGAVRVAYDLPCDMQRLATSPALPALDARNEDVFDMASADRLADALGMSLQTPWAPQLPKVRLGADLLRYNRIEGLSVGLEVTQKLGTGRDEGFYYRTLGASLGERREQRTGTLEYRLFLERQWTAGDTTVTSTFSLARMLFSRRFNRNIIAEPSTFTGIDLTWSRTWFDQPRGWRLTGIARAEAATGTFEYLRGSYESTLSHGLGRRARLAVTGAAGSSAGRLPVQRSWYVGGLRTVRGQLPATQSGDAFWYGRTELGTRQGIVRPVVFYDLGWAGRRTAWGQVPPQRGAGVGVGLLDGLLRLDLARGLSPNRVWRTDIYFGAPL